MRVGWYRRPDARYAVAMRPAEVTVGKHGRHGMHGTRSIRAQIRAQPTRSRAARTRAGESPVPAGSDPVCLSGGPGSHQRDGCLIWGLEGRFARQPARWSIPKPGLQSGHPHGVRPPSSGRNSIEQTCSVGSQCRPWHSWLQSTECRQVQSAAGLVAIAISPLAVSRAWHRGGVIHPGSRDCIPLGRHRIRKGIRAGVPARTRRASQPTSGGMLAVSQCSYRRPVRWDGYLPPWRACWRWRWSGS
jgi:hypothetical protein